MQDVQAPIRLSGDVGPLVAFWRVDEAARSALSQIGAVIARNLADIVLELDEVLLGDAKCDQMLADVTQRHRETELLVAFHLGVFQNGFDAASAERAVALGRHHAELGLDGRVIVGTAQRVLERALEAALAAGLADPGAALGAVTRVIFLGIDVALASLRSAEAQLHVSSESEARAEALQVQLQHMAEMARIDGLTKLFNRRHFDTAFDSEITRAHRYGLPLCLIMADVDHFKRINDTYGHAIGDEVLCHVADLLQSDARRSDLVARYGGEEFAIILTSTPGEHAALVAERIRVSLEQRPVAFADGHLLRLTISLGYGVLSVGDTPKKLLARADQALYRAKEGGRNRVCG